MSFVELKRWIREEAARMGASCSSREAHAIARTVWMQNEDEDDLSEGLTDVRMHSDPTAIEAIRRVMLARFHAVRSVAA